MRQPLLRAALAIAVAACSAVPPTEPSEPDVGPHPSPTKAAGSSVSPPDAIVAPTDEPSPPVPTDRGAADEDRSSQGLIIRAVEEGRLDFATSLLYRAYAMFGDPRLPEEYRGEGSAGEDTGLFVIPDAMGDQLPDELHRALEPFLLSPLDPRSIFHRSPEGAAGAPIAAVGPLLLPPGPVSDAVACGSHGWGSQNARVPIKIWIQCTGDFEQDVALALDAVNLIYRPMTELMGRPLLDRGAVENGYGGDESIDLFLTTDTACPPDPDGPCYPVSGNTLGWALRLPPRDEDAGGSGTSGMMVIRRSLIGNADRDLFRRVLIHELFHVLQYAIIGHGMAVPTGQTDHQGRPVIEAFWFTEASATWAMYHFERQLGNEASATAAIRDYLPGFQTSDRSLNARNPVTFRYHAFVWPFFIVQERGDPNVIPAAWRALVGQPDERSMMGALSSQVSFREKFRDFAVRNFNKTLGDPDPLAPRYQAEFAPFPEIEAGGTKRRGRHHLEPRNEPYRYFELTVPLSAGYWEFDVSDAEIEQLKFDFSGLAPSDAFAVDVLLWTRQDEEPYSRWERRKLSGTKLELCRSRPGEDFVEAYAVISNHDLDGRSTNGWFIVEALKEPCEEVDLLYEFSGRGGHVEPVDFRIEVNLEPTEDGGLTGVGNVSGRFWKNWDGGYDYCVVKQIEGTIEVTAVFSGGDLIVISGGASVRFSDGDETFIPGPGGFVIPLDTGMAERSRPASDPDEVDGACFAFSNTTEKVTLP